MKKVEEVARALEASFKETVAGSSGVPFEQSGVSLPSADIWRRYALAALKALREPNDDLLEAVPDIANDTSGAPYVSDHSFFREQWNALLDHLIKEAGE